MSMLNLACSQDAAYIVTDGGFWQADGRLSSLGSKVRTIPHLRMAVSTIGPDYVLPLMVASIAESTIRCYDDLADNLPSFARATVEKIGGQGGIPRHWGQFALAVAGWSDRNHCAATALLWVESKPVAPVYKLVDPTGFVTPPPPHGLKLDTADIERSAVALALDQRSKNQDGLAPGVEVVAVAGFVELTTVTRNAVASRILRRWPDEVRG